MDNSSAVFAYRKAWKALNTMLEEGKSYSGFERNSAFLNMGAAADGSPRYANVSGASGLDLMEDGRSVGVVDWDLDGRLDFWISNRTAPRLRLQHNRSVTGNSFASLKLGATTGNRQAVGARVSLAVRAADSGATTLRVRTVRAGEGFLAQGSCWVHFGIADGEAIAGVTVRWPGSTAAETIAGVAPGGFFLIEEGSGNARPWQPPATSARALAAHEEKGEDAAPPSGQARIVMASRLPMPSATYTGLDGERRQLATGGRPLLLNLWASWCAPCLAEMKQWSADAGAITATGLRVLALSVDEPEAATETRIALVRPFLDRLAFPFAAGLADAALLETLEVAGRAQIDKFEAFPVPSSILLDARGHIAFVYKGPVTVAQLQQDMTLLEADQATLNAQAAHFPGTWIEGPWPPTPTVMIDKFMSFGNPEAAKAYLDAFTVATGDARANQGLAESYFLVANELRIQGSDAEALGAYARTLELNPGKTRAHLDRGTLLFKLRRYAEATPHLKAAVDAQPDVLNTRKLLSLSLLQARRYQEAVEAFEALVARTPDDAIGRMWFGHSLVRARRAADAAAQFRESLRLQPDSFVVANELAWLLATHSSAEVRAPEEALRLATSAAAATGHRNPRVLDTLAAAHAANGDFEGAVRVVDEAIAIATASAPADREALDGLERRRGIYAARRPYREVAPREQP